MNLSNNQKAIASAVVREVTYRLRHKCICGGRKVPGGELCRPCALKLTDEGRKQ
jgi:hypothetical protein